MAGRLIGAWNPALDSTGVSISGAKLHTYIAGTTTPKATYTTVALSTPQANPVIADSAGRFPELWAADGATFDLKWTDASGVQIALFQSIQTLGSTATGAVTRDFGADGRFNLESRGGTTYLESGDPSPDNIGGKLRVGGWSGTQADLITLDGAEVAVVGALSVPTWKANSGPSEILVNSGTITVAQATLDISLSGSFNAYRLVLVGIEPATDNTTLRLRVSVDNGATYKSGASDYGYAGHYTDSSAADTAFRAANSTAVQIQPIGVTNSTGYSPSVDLQIRKPPGTNVVFMWNGWMADQALDQVSFSGGGRTIWPNATHVRLLFSSGNISLATWALYGLRGV